MADKSFATSLSCMYGRVQIPMNDWIKAKYAVDFVDTITAPGIDKVMFDGNVESLKKELGGGTVLDLGIYCIQFSLLAFCGER